MSGNIPDLQLISSYADLCAELRTREAKRPAPARRGLRGQHCCPSMARAARGRTLLHRAAARLRRQRPTGKACAARRRPARAERD